MDIKNPQYFIAIADAKSLSKAAARIFVSQSSLSYYVSSIEESLGIKLLDRFPNGVNLTPEGELYLAACRKIVEIGDSLSIELSEAKFKEQLTVCSSSKWGRAALAALIPDFVNTHPDIKVHVAQAPSALIFDKFENNEADFALIDWNPHHLMLKNDTLLNTEQLFFIIPATHPFADTHPEKWLTLHTIASAFQDDRFILSSLDDAISATVQYALDEIGFSPKRFFTVDDRNLLKDLVTRGCGVSFVQESHIGRNSHEDPSALRCYAVKGLVCYNLLMCRPIQSLSQTEKDFRGLVLNYFGHGQKP